MGFFRFQKRTNLGGGARLNLSKRGIGASWGVRGFRTGVGPRGTRTTVSLPGTGISYVSTSGPSRSHDHATRHPTRALVPIAPTPAAPPTTPPVTVAPTDRALTQWAQLGGIWVRIIVDIIGIGLAAAWIALRGVYRWSSRHLILSLILLLTSDIWVRVVWAFFLGMCQGALDLIGIHVQLS